MNKLDLDHLIFCQSSSRRPVLHPQCAAFVRPARYQVADVTYRRDRCKCERQHMPNWQTGHLYRGWTPPCSLSTQSPRFFVTWPLPNFDSTTPILAVVRSMPFPLFFTHELISTLLANVRPIRRLVSVVAPSHLFSVAFLPSPSLTRPAFSSLYFICFISKLVSSLIQASSSISTSMPVLPPYFSLACSLCISFTLIFPYIQTIVSPLNR